MPKAKIGHLYGIRESNNVSVFKGRVVRRRSALCSTLSGVASQLALPVFVQVAANDSLPVPDHSDVFVFVDTWAFLPTDHATFAIAFLLLPVSPRFHKCSSMAQWALGSSLPDMLCCPA